MGARGRSRECDEGKRAMDGIVCALYTRHFYRIDIRAVGRRYLLDLETEC